MHLRPLRRRSSRPATARTGPFSVMATECSKWAERLPSFVTAVQPSSSMTTSGSPALIMGSMATTSPADSRPPLPRVPVVRDVGLLVHLPADPVPHELPDHRIAQRLDVGLHRLADVAQPVARDALRDGQLQRLAGRVDQRLGLRRRPCPWAWCAPNRRTSRP